MRKRVCLFLAMILCLSFLFISCKENVDTVTLTFDCAGGKEIDPITIISGQQVFLPSTTKNSFYLAGWYTESPSDFFEDGTVINSNTTFHASWLENPQLTLEFTTTGTACASQTIVYGKQYTLPVSNKNNELFLGWYTDSSCSTPFTNPNSISTKESLTIILYAKWESTPFIYEFTKENGIPVSATITGPVNPDEDITDVVIKPYGTLPTTIADNLFQGNPHLKGNLTFEEGIVGIGANAFQGCSNINGMISIPSSLSSIGSGAFCSSKYSAFVVDANNQNFVSEDGLLYNLDKTTILACSPTKTGNLSIPSSVKTIGDSAFQGCTGLTGDLVIPPNVTSIGNAAFEWCIGFKGSLTLPAELQSIEDSVFEGCSGLTGTLTIPSTVESIGDAAFEGCKGLTGDLSIQSTVTSIRGFAFAGCSGFTGSLTLPNNLTTIAESTFEGCYGFTSLTLSDDLQSIRYNAFNGCKGFQGDLIIPEKVEYIDEQAFMLCEGLNGTLTLPATIISIRDDAFSGCKLSSTLKYKGTQAQWNTFYSSSSSWNHTTEGDYPLIFTTIQCSDGTITL